MELQFFYAVRKTTRLATIAEAHEAIEGSRNVVNNVLLPPNADDFGYQKNNTNLVTTESLEIIYKPAEELEIEELLETSKLNCLCRHVPKKDDKNCLNGKKSLVLKELFKTNNLISQKISQT